ncbi:MAG: exodeoxyribonuclease VII small subunit [Candidatus Cloacimonetes bacterium 4572_65]|nr:MAG: exodeoxyribonuclease VII small subunit [Candidatus Cloacimonetes bacterium 4572_65]
MAKSQEISYEKAMVKLNEIVYKIENSELPLDELVDLYEEGASLIKYCENELKRFDEKIKMINRKKQEIV